MIGTASFPPAALLVVAVLVATVTAQDGNDMDDRDRNCRLWMAPSHTSTESKPKYGIFAGVEFNVGDIIPNSELGVPAIDLFIAPNFNTSPETRDMLNALESMLWTTDQTGSMWEGSYSVSSFIPGIGMHALFHSGYSNVDWSPASVLLRGHSDLFAPGVAHPSRGAITPYDNVTMKATQHIMPGMELFANYGKHYERDNDQEDIFQDRLTREDYEEADKVLKHIVEFMQTHAADMDGETTDKILDFMLDTVLETYSGKRAKVIRSLIPAHPRKLQRVLDAGGTFAYRNRDMVKSHEWLVHHGVCIDKLRSGKSTIPDAGRGAFATRTLALGETIAVAPMIPIKDSTIMSMYEIQEGGQEIAYDRSKPIGEQLLVNYCFSHPESSLLLLPTGSHVSFMNHARHGNGANAFLTWAKHDFIENDHSLHDSDISSLSLSENPNLVMLVQTTREIEEGEEIFIDYGPDWEKAWLEYKSEWEQKHADGKWPLRAEDVMLNYKTSPFPVDLMKDALPYPPGIATACFIKHDEVPDGMVRVNENGETIVQWVGPTTFDEHFGRNLLICDVQSRKVDKVNMYNYTVIVEDDDETLEVRNVPHAAIRLVDEPYAGDIHTPGAFRHWISIEDQRFPQAWRNLRK